MPDNTYATDNQQDESPRQEHYFRLERPRESIPSILSGRVKLIRKVRYTGKRLSKESTDRARHPVGNPCARAEYGNTALQKTIYLFRKTNGFLNRERVRSITAEMDREHQENMGYNLYTEMRPLNLNKEARNIYTKSVLSTAGIAAVFGTGVATTINIFTGFSIPVEIAAVGGFTIAALSGRYSGLLETGYTRKLLEDFDKKVRTQNSKQRLMAQVRIAAEQGNTQLFQSKAHKLADILHKDNNKKGVEHDRIFEKIIWATEKMLDFPHERVQERVEHIRKTDPREIQRAAEKAEKAAQKQRVAEHIRRHAEEGTGLIPAPPQYRPGTTAQRLVNILGLPRVLDGRNR